MDPFPPVAKVTAVTTVSPYTGLLRFLLSPKTHVMSQNEPCLTLKMPECCRNPLEIRCFCPVDVGPPVVGRFRVVTGKPACWRCAETPLLPLGWTATPTATATTDGSHQRPGSTETTRTAADCLRGTTERTLGGVFASQTANMARQRWVPGRHHLRGTPVATPVQVGLHAGPRGAGIAQRVVRVVGQR